EVRRGRGSGREARRKEVTEGESDLERAATAEGLPVAPSVGPALEAARVPLERSLIDARVVLICAWARRAGDRDWLCGPGPRRHHRPGHEYRVLRPLLRRIRFARKQPPRLAG